MKLNASGLGGLKRIEKGGGTEWLKLVDTTGTLLVSLETVTELRRERTWGLFPYHPRRWRFLNFRKLEGPVLNCRGGTHRVYVNELVIHEIRNTSSALYNCT
jgi:hypothetical protein